MFSPTGYWVHFKASCHNPEFPPYNRETLDEFALPVLHFNEDGGPVIARGQGLTTPQNERREWDDGSTRDFSCHWTILPWHELPADIRGE